MRVVILLVVIAVIAVIGVATGLHGCSGNPAPAQPSGMTAAEVQR